ncbi:hypothetical protein F4859DRAFT_467560 [Xylaria cf. heliscus]|nr:hypothetical protein F4859DRAFT_467560 [Xylaria cf. heliscus]
MVLGQPPRRPASCCFRLDVRPPRGHARPLPLPLRLRAMLRLSRCAVARCKCRCSWVQQQPAKEGKRALGITSWLMATPSPPMAMDTPPGARPRKKKNLLLRTLPCPTTAGICTVLRHTCRLLVAAKTWFNPLPSFIRGASCMSYTTARVVVYNLIVSSLLFYFYFFLFSHLPALG